MDVCQPPRWVLSSLLSSPLAPLFERLCKRQKAPIIWVMATYLISFIFDTFLSSSNNFLDTVFGTDGRKRKDKGVWTWIKTTAKSSTSEKRKSKLAQQQQQQQQPQQPHQKQPNHIHTRSSSVASNMSHASSSTSLPVTGFSSPSTYAPSSPTYSSQSTLTLNHHTNYSNGTSSKRNSIISNSSTQSSATLQNSTSPHSSSLPRERAQSAYALPFASQTLPYHPQQYQQSQALYHSNNRRMDPGRRASESNMPSMLAHQGLIQRSASAGRARPFSGRVISEEATEPMVEGSDVENGAELLRRSQSKKDQWWWE
ncbi:hypothetical protein BG005_011306 [Podila minutissima]|nr:hypothetical protein BG005_011306 [Podila minutissima]